MGVALVEVFLACRVPAERLVVVQGVAAAEEDVLELFLVVLVFAEFLADGGEVVLRALVPGAVVRLVEGRYADDLQAVVLHIALGEGYQLAPAVGLRNAAGAAIPVGDLFEVAFHLVGVEVDAGMGSVFLHNSDALVQLLLLGIGERSVEGLCIRCLEAQADDVYQLLTGEVHTTLDVALAEPREVQSPSDIGQLDALVADAIGHGDAVVGDGGGLHGTGAGGLCETTDGSCEEYCCEDKSFHKTVIREFVG